MYVRVIGGGTVEHPGDEQWRLVTVTEAIDKDAKGDIVLQIGANVPFIPDLSE